MAHEWAPHGINVNVLNPGFILTDMNRKTFEAEFGRAVVASFPRQRLGDPSDLDGAILLLAAPSSRFITGASLSVHDGQKYAGR
jgi:NAD(P)-dependent dehydrogenase (short-subunit alcohol dehydrogenase family)